MSRVRIGILGGTGPAGSGLAARLASVGFGVVLGSRSRERAEETCDALAGRWEGIGRAVEPADNAGAASAEVVVVATPWHAAAPTVSAVAAELEGKVVISMANALVRVGGEFQPLMPPRGSVAAGVQAALPRSRVVAALHHVPAKELGDLRGRVETDVLVCSDHPEATETCIGILRRVPGLRPLDAGALSNAAPIEAFVAVLLQLNGRYATRASVRFTGIDVDR